MSYPPELLSWTREVSSHLPHLTSSQARVRAWYSLAVTLVQSSGLSHVAYFLAGLLGQEENTVRQRLREVVYESEQKRGTHRREVDVVLCFAPLLKWVLTHWRNPDAVLCLALDATMLRQTFTVLSISVLVGRCAIPIAWTVLPATQPGAWKPGWQSLLSSLHVPSALTVLVMADRGLYAHWLFAELVTLGWHPLLRIKAQGWVHVHETNHRLPLAQLANACSGKWWHGQITCFLGQQIQGAQVSRVSLGTHPHARPSPCRTLVVGARVSGLAPCLAHARGCSPLNLAQASPSAPIGCAHLAHALPGYPLRMQVLPPAPCLEFVTQLKTYP